MILVLRKCKRLYHPRLEFYVVNLMDDFQLLRFSGGFNSRKAVSEYLKVNISTVNRWENKEVKAPFAVCELMRLLSGELPAVGRRDSWQGWSFMGEYIYNPSGNRYTEGDINEIFINRQRVRTYEVDTRILEKEIQLLKARIEELTTKPAAPVKVSNVLRFPNLKQG